MKKRINIAVMGTGFMGKVHSHAWRTVGKIFETGYEPVLKVAFGTDEKDTKSFAERWGYEDCSLDWQKVIERPDIDIVDIVAPTIIHKDMVVYAAEHGKNVFCEKPCCLTSADATVMAEACEKAGVVSYLNHNYRRIPAVAFAKQLIDEGKLGDIYHFRGAYLQDWIMDPNFPLTWHMQKKFAGGGPLFDLGSHSIDLARYLIGEIGSVSAELRTFIKERPLPGAGAATFTAGANTSSEKGAVTIDDAAFMTLNFANGITLGSCEVSRFAGGRRNYNYFEIYGSKGSLIWNLERLNELMFLDLTEPYAMQGFRNIMMTAGDHPYMSKWWAGGHIVGYETTFVNAMNDYLNCLANGTEAAPNFRDGEKIIRVLEAAIQSSEEQRVITL
ncbi:MAG: Gfo/Idh/MocA family oxidoreductase [Planctomycetia bacterium]|nr:Gfo/Idh/MocA family oxidoreductase [Planctomycetia bacterium]